MEIRMSSETVECPMDCGVLFCTHGMDFDTAIRWCQSHTGKVMVLECAPVDLEHDVGEELTMKAVNGTDLVVLFSSGDEMGRIGDLRFKHNLLLKSRWNPLG